MNRTRRNFLATTAALGVAGLLGYASFGKAGGLNEPEHDAKAVTPYNVLFIVLDDLRPELGCYGNPTVRTPHIDALAREGTLFTKAYCQVPVCGASRASLFTGLRPTRERFLDFEAWIDKDVPGTTTLPTHFKDNGYTTISNGKVFHHLTDSRESWSEPAWAPKGHWRDYKTEENIRLATPDTKKFIGNSFEAADVDDTTYIDGKVTKKSIADLKRLKENGKPFFLAVGLRKPHLPFNAPRKYWDIYDRKSIPRADNPFTPKDAPLESIHNSFELRVYKDIPDSGTIGDSIATTLKHGYYACVSYVDALVGDLLTEVQRLGLADNTIIVLWGDNGYQLGEHALWCKHCNYETSLNVPLIIRMPGMPSRGNVASLVECVDVYPTLCELTRLSVPAHLQGDSFALLLEGKKEKTKEEVFCRFQKGESIRTDRYLLTEFAGNDGKPVARMLFDHQVDPQENNNVAGAKQYTGIAEELSRKLEMHRARYYRRAHRE
jgi:arylsulfatase A-like enzyme